MQKKKFSIRIKAPREIVWNVLWNDDTYRAWTSVFSEGSHAESDWKEGSRILFGDGKGAGMYSLIEKKVDNEFMSFKHLGELKGGTEEKTEEAKDWAGSHENYFLRQDGEYTELTVELDVVPEFESYFSETFPKALEKVKQISEKQAVASV